MVNQYPQYYQNYPNYQQQYQQPMQMVQQPVQQAQNQILAWVQSEDEGRNFPLGAGQSIFLMNQREPYLYMKSVDQLGKMTFIKKRLEDEGGSQDDKVDMSAFIRKEDIESLITDIVQREVEKRVSEISFKPTRPKKTVVVDDED